jgi:hypothetical protein
MNYGEAASAMLIAVDIEHLFKKFYKGFDANILTWLPYDKDEDNELVLLVNFWFEIGCSDETATAIFNCIIKPYILPAEFCHGHGKMATGAFLLGNLPTYEFYNPSFLAHQFGLGQLPHQLFFMNTLKPKEGISEPMKSLGIFQLGLDLPTFHLHEWAKATFSLSLFDSWWQEWHSHLFCSPVHPNCLALDEDFASDGEVIHYAFLSNRLANNFFVNSLNQLL